MTVAQFLLALVLFVSLGLLAIARQKRGLRLPPPQLPAEPIAQRELHPWEIAEIQRQQKAQAKMAAGKRAFALRPGTAWNPMRNYPRNAKCTCGSGKKFKVCCLPSLPLVCPKDREKRLRGLVELAEQGVNVPMELAKAQARLRDQQALKDTAAKV